MASGRNQHSIATQSFNCSADRLGQFKFRLGKSFFVYPKKF